MTEEIAPAGTDAAVGVKDSLAYFTGTVTSIYNYNGLAKLQITMTATDGSGSLKSFYYPDDMGQYMANNFNLFLNTNQPVSIQYDSSSGYVWSIGITNWP